MIMIRTLIIITIAIILLTLTGQPIRQTNSSTFLSLFQRSHAPFPVLPDGDAAGARDGQERPPAAEEGQGQALRLRQALQRGVRAGKPLLPLAACLETTSLLVSNPGSTSRKPTIHKP